MAERTETINAQGIEIGVVRRGDDDYISLTDIARYKSDEPSAVIANWMRLRDTIDYLGVWESLNNPEFNSLEFEGIEAEAGRNSFSMSPRKWIKLTNAIGIRSKGGRYGGTYAHTDIAFDFASWISPEFKLYIIKDYQRLGIIDDFKATSLNKQYTSRRWNKGEPNEVMEETALLYPRVLRRMRGDGIDIGMRQLEIAEIIACLERTNTRREGSAVVLKLRK